MGLAQSAAEFKKLASSFKAVFEFAEEIEKIANLDAEKLKVDQATSAANASYNKAVTNLQEVQATAAITQLKAEEVLKNAEAKDEAIVSGAKAQSSSLIQEAQGVKAKVEDKIVSLNAEMADLRAQVQAGKSELSEIESKVKEVKQKLAEFVG